MKKILPIFLLFFVFSCRNNDDDLQTIDQIMQLFIKDSSGKDLLNSKIPGAYKTMAMYDLDGATDQVPVTTFSLKKTADTVTFLEYAAGAKRILQDSTSPQSKTYRSDILLKLQKTAAADADADTMVILYNWTPQKFEIGKVKYNGSTVFTKTPGATNTFTVVK